MRAIAGAQTQSRSLDDFDQPSQPYQFGKGHDFMFDPAINTTLTDHQDMFPVMDRSVQASNTQYSFATGNPSAEDFTFATQDDSPDLRGGDDTARGQDSLSNEGSTGSSVEDDLNSWLNGLSEDEIRLLIGED